MKTKRRAASWSNDTETKRRALNQSNEMEIMRGESKCSRTVESEAVDEK